MQWLKWRSNDLETNNRQHIGQQKELEAKRFLESKGLVIKEQNFHCRFGEIDLIAVCPEEQTLVFVEVRYRKSQKYGGAAASITASKQAKIKKTALFYLATRKLDANVRFDVIAIEQQQLNWIQSAFS